MKDAFKILRFDKKMAGLIETYGELALSGSGAYFSDLVWSIIGQQLSAKAADTIYNRVAGLVGGDVTSEKISGISDELLRQAGVSQKKISYIRNLTQGILDGAIDLSALNRLSDEEIISKLSACKGIGRWTAEMFLIFSLARPDVFSHGDLGLNSAINNLYSGAEKLTKKEITEISDKWRPYRSLASLYLWRSLDNR